MLALSGWYAASAAAEARAAGIAARGTGHEGEELGLRTAARPSA
ncbi:hypothetical protein [Streptosporangium vulgare]